MYNTRLVKVLQTQDDLTEILARLVLPELFLFP
jgi:hypothetical protein